MPKSIIICCDGTGNEIKENQSNVLKFYRTLKRDDGQIAYYDPGVGTISDSGLWADFKNKLKSVMGLLLGFGLDKNVLEAYRFLIRSYEPGDQVYLFGFSRGAYTIRVLAGMLHLVGLLSPNQRHLCGYALTAYKQAHVRDSYKITWRMHRVLQTRHVPIQFMGCWDTVSSVITLRRDKAYLPSLQKLPFTAENPRVRVFRHALAIDERRRMFRPLGWLDGQDYANPETEAAPVAQDAKEVWFAGVHSDIGGGYPEGESGLAKITLAWMIGEAKAHGVRFDEERVKLLVMGQNTEGSTWDYAAPAPGGVLHRSLRRAWRILEYLPKRTTHLEWPARRSFLGFYLPRAEPRPIDKGADIHPAVRARVQKVVGYGPENLPPEG